MPSVKGKPATKSAPSGGAWLTPALEKTLNRLEAQIDKGFLDALMARWDSGNELLGVRQGNVLPPGELKPAAELLEVSTRELQRRMTFAKKCKRDDLRQTLSRYGSWNKIVTQLLSPPADPNRPEPTVERIKTQIAGLTIIIRKRDGEDLTDSDYRAAVEAIEVQMSSGRGAPPTPAMPPQRKKGRKVA